MIYIYRYIYICFKCPEALQNNSPKLHHTELCDLFYTNNISFAFHCACAM